MNYIDLGLSVLWADCNIGTDTPEGYGDHLFFNETRKLPNVSVPTIEQWRELLGNKCTWTWTIQNGVNGHRITSRINGNSIFLPAAGYRNENGLCLVGALGDYWSSSNSLCDPYLAQNVYFGLSNIMGGISDCDCGCSVRPILPKETKETNNEIEAIIYHPDERYPAQIVAHYDGKLKHGDKIKIKIV